MQIKQNSDGPIMHLVKGVITSVGLKPLALKLYNVYRKVIYSVRSRFRTVVADTEVTFVTEDDHSKRFFHYRYKNGQMHEPPVSRELAERVRSAKVFADVGAHLGYYSCIAGVINPNLKLFLFEMNRNLISLIERNLMVNGLNDAEIVNQAVSDGAKTIGYTAGSTDAGLSMRAPGEDSDEITAETVSLDGYFAPRDVMPDVIKIDVQGAEMEVLRGAKRIIREHCPVVFLEVHPKLLGAFGTTPDDVYRFLIEHGYDQLYLINEHRRDLGRLLPFDAERGGPPHTHMLLCAGSTQTEKRPSQPDRANREQ